jgi:hypothetical protein
MKNDLSLHKQQNIPPSKRADVTIAPHSFLVSLHMKKIFPNIFNSAMTRKFLKFSTFGAVHGKFVRGGDQEGFHIYAGISCRRCMVISELWGGGSYTTSPPPPLNTLSPMQVFPVEMLNTGLPPQYPYSSILIIISQCVL